MDKPLRIVILAFGSAGDIFPLLGVADRLQQRGHEVIFCCTPYFEPEVRRLGLAFEPVGTAEDYLKATSNEQLWHPTRALKYLAGLVAEGTPSVIELTQRLVEPGRTVVVSVMLGFGVRIAHEVAAGTDQAFPLVTVHLQPGVLFTVEGPPVMPTGTDLNRYPKWVRRILLSFASRMADRAVKEIEHQRRDLGLPPQKNLMLEYPHSPDRVLGLWPGWYGPPAPDWPSQLRLVGFPIYDGPAHNDELADELQQFIDREGPPIVFAPGTGNRYATNFFASGVEAANALNRPAVLLTRFEEQLPNLHGKRAIHVSQAPLGQLLKRSCALVQHGGIGTTARGLAAGLPQLVCPMTHDQPDNAARVKRLGVGEVLPWKGITAKRMQTALQQLLSDPDLHARVQSLAEKVNNEDGLAAAATEIEKMQVK